MAEEGFVSIFSPVIKSKKNERIPLTEVNSKIVDFYTVYAPDKLKESNNHALLIKYAEKNGYLALERNIKTKYGCIIEEADNTEQGWYRVRRNLEMFYAKHKVSKSSKEVLEMVDWTKKKGLAALDEKLKEKYNESLSEFQSSKVIAWKHNWQEALTSFTAEHFQYQLSRFYAFLETLTGQKKTPQEISDLVKWAMKHNRLEVNEKLLHKYGICLEDVKMVEGLSDLDRFNNLTAKLAEFFQAHDPKLLEENPKLIQDIAARGMIYYEEMNEKLKVQYNADLDTSGREKLNGLISAFYAKHDPGKSQEQIDRIVRFGLEKGIEALNEKLALKYGEDLGDIPVSEV